QAARSGRQNIIEGSERASTSKDTEMKLTDVARASLSELRGDFEIFILDRGYFPWSVHQEQAKAINSISIDNPLFNDDSVHESAKHAISQRAKYALWLDDQDAIFVANTLLLMISRTLNMLKRQIESQGKAFEEKGGFSERLHARRIENRNGPGSNTIECPKCSKPMRRRKGSKGEFWGCSGYPDCRGTREF
ncbi:MAG: four helix bundle suffix domain-containing protein, partial [Pirellula sp.]